MNDRKLTALREIEFFAPLRKKELQQVAALCEEVFVDTGTALMTEDTFGTHCYVIADGVASVVIDDEVVSTLGAGQVVGEMALIDRGPRTATVVASTPMKAFAFSAREFLGVMDQYPAVAHKVNKALAQRLRAADASAAGKG